MFGWLPAVTICGVRMQAAQSRVGKVLSNWAMCPPIDGSRSTRWTREARIGDLERGRDAGDPAAHDQRGRVDRHPVRLQRRVLRDAQDATGHHGLGLGGGGLLIGVDPGDLLADGDQLAQVRVETRSLARAAERLLVHVRRTGRDDDTGQAQLADVFLDQLLPKAGAHELVVAGHHDALGAELLCRPVAHRLDVHDAGDVRAAVADVDADALLGRRCHDRTSGCVIGLGHARHGQGLRAPRRRRGVRRLVLGGGLEGGARAAG